MQIVFTAGFKNAVDAFDEGLTVAGGLTVKTAPVEDEDEGVIGVGKVERVARCQRAGGALFGRFSQA